MTKTPSDPMSAQQIRDLLGDMTRVESANWHLDNPALFEAVIVHKRYVFDEGPDDRAWETIQAYSLGEMFLAYGSTREERERDARQRIGEIARQVALDNRTQGLCWKFFKDPAHPWQYLIKYSADRLAARPPGSSPARTLEIKTIQRAVIEVDDPDAYLAICGLAPFMNASVIDEHEGYILFQVAPGLDDALLESVIANAMTGGNPLPPAWQDFLDARKQAIRNGCQELEVRLAEQ